MGKENTPSNFVLTLGFRMVRLHRKEDGREAFPPTIFTCMYRQQRTAFHPLDDARSSYKPATIMDSGVLVTGCADVLGGEDRAIVGEGSKVRGYGVAG